MLQLTKAFLGSVDSRSSMLEGWSHVPPWYRNASLVCKCTAASLEALKPPSPLFVTCTHFCKRVAAVFVHISSSDRGAQVIQTQRQMMLRRFSGTPMLLRSSPTCGEHHPVIHSHRPLSLLTRPSDPVLSHLCQRFAPSSKLRPWPGRELQNSKLLGLEVGFKPQLSANSLD